MNDPATGTVVGADAGGLLLRALLFESNVIDSSSLREFPHLIRSFGIEQLTALLEHGDFQIMCDSRTLADFGAGPGESSASRGRVNGGNFRINLGWDVPPQSWFGHVSDDLEASLNASCSKHETSSFLSVLEECFVPLPNGFGVAAVAQLELDLASENHELHAAALRHVLRTHGLMRRDETSELWIDVAALGGGSFRVATNLAKFGIESEQRHDLVREALFAIGGVNVRLEEMQALGAVSGFQPDELPIFEGKLAFFAKSVMPEGQTERFNQVVTLSGLPDIAAPGSGDQVDVDRLLEIRRSSECREFRSWLRTFSAADSVEIEERVANFRSRVAGTATSTFGRVVRFGITTGAGLIPGIGLPLGLGLGALDGFVLEKLVGEPGPTAFLDRQYRSIF
ncbi:hypothetical protein AB0L40_08490 [Patulibacter sp. NPDC049589]|uniref:hypothetical protein n=1 Tax=Patulibacter sp. NPDC049589 TaxID=3154731 RepID=UPI00341B4CAB